VGSPSTRRRPVESTAAERCHVEPGSAGCDARITARRAKAMFPIRAGTTDDNTFDKTYPAMTRSARASGRRPSPNGP
jgi:hypothetical protein